VRGGVNGETDPATRAAVHEEQRAVDREVAYTRIEQLRERSAVAHDRAAAGEDAAGDRADSRGDEARAAHHRGRAAHHRHAAVTARSMIDRA
jgi:hypothetical protein